MSKLAVFGGEKVRNRPFMVWPMATPNEKKYLNEVVNSNGWGIFRGSKIVEFGKKFADYHGAKYGIPCSNATVALEVQLKCLGVKRGDEVITTVFTCISTIYAIINIGAIPIFVDINEDDYCIDTSKIEKKITTRTKAIIPVHLYNSTCDLDSLVKIAKKYKLFLVEDAAQIPGSFYKNRAVGTYGNSGSFSFQEAKSMTSGEGSIIITNDENLYNLANSYINCGRIGIEENPSRRVMGGNYRMTEFQAAILLGQLELLKERTDKREKSSIYLNKKLDCFPGIKTIPRDPKVTKQGCYYFIFKIVPEILGVRKEYFVAALEAEGIPTRKLFVPIYKDPLFNLNEYDSKESWNYYKKNPINPKEFSIAERAGFDEGIALWHPLLLEDNDGLDDILKAIEKIIINIDELKKKNKK